MKGTLHKTEQGWIVEYAKHSELPLHPDDESLWMFAELNEEWKDKLDDKEVEFEIVSEPNIYRSVGNIQENYASYAKLIPSKEQQKQLITEIMDLDAKDGLYEDDVWKVGLEDELNKLPYTKHLDDGQYNDGQLVGFELGATWGYNKAKETLYTEEQVNQKMIDFAEWCRTQYKLNGETFLIEQLFSEYKSLKQPKKD